MIQHVLMPKLGQTMEEARVEAWHKAEGDKVAKGDVLMEIQTDKAVLEVESFVEGTLLRIVARKGETFPVNTVVALVGDPGDPLPDVEELRRKALAAKAGHAAPAAKAAAAPAAAVPASPTLAVASARVKPPEGRFVASPRARRRAREEKTPLHVLTGTGPNGRVVEKDVIAYAEQVRQIRVTPTALEVAFEQGVDLRRVRGTGPAGKVTKDDVLAAAAAPAVPAAGKAVEMSAMRRLVAERMSRSKREAPHFYLTMEVDMTQAVALRKAVNAKGGVKVSFHDLLILACGRALAEQPAMNVAIQDGRLVQRAEVHIGLAVALDEGLVAPVVRNVDRLTLTGVAEKSHDLIDKARGKRLTPDEYQGGCLTISNLGMFDVDWFYPIVIPGETAILGVGRIAEKAVVIGGGIHVRPMMSLALCADHRAVDGATAATFLKRIKDLLQAPEGMG